MDSAFNPITGVNDLAVLDKCLRWQACKLFIMDGLAALQIGSTARNLSGALMVSKKIVPAIVKPIIIPYSLVIVKFHGCFDSDRLC